jgi:hypothetical protein
MRDVFRLQDSVLEIYVQKERRSPGRKCMRLSIDARQLVIAEAAKRKTRRGHPSPGPGPAPMLGAQR